jgi:hypothetical protein
MKGSQTFKDGFLERTTLQRRPHPGKLDVRPHVSSASFGTGVMLFWNGFSSATYGDNRKHSNLRSNPQKHLNVYVLWNQGQAKTLSRNMGSTDGYICWRSCHNQQN